MNVLRSPTGSDSGRSLSGSQPNLSEVQSDSEPCTKITLRTKRKYTDDNDLIRNELAGLRKQMSEMMALLKSTRSDQAENINKLRQDVTAIKTEVSNISNTIENIILENTNLKSKLTSLSSATEITEKKVKLLEADVKNLKSTSPNTYSSQKPMIERYEDIVNEIHERNLRSKNLIIVGIPESTAKTSIARRESEKEEISKITKQIYNDCPSPEKIIRLGKYIPERTRPIKICFKSEETAKLLLRNKNAAVLDNIKIYSDQTQNQRKYMQNLKDELHKRTAEGEAHLQIKYIKGIPKIITSEKISGGVITESKN